MTALLAQQSLLCHQSEATEGNLGGPHLQPFQDIVSQTVESPIQLVSIFHSRGAFSLLVTFKGFITLAQRDNSF